MLYVIAGLLVVIAALLVAVCLRLEDLVKQEVNVEQEIRRLRLKSRTRIRRASVQSGAVTEEQQLLRLGRASIGRRIVVGGDPDSQLSQQLNAFQEETDERS